MASLWYALFTWNIPPASEEELKTADAIVTQAYSPLKNNAPGPGNDILAKVTRALYERYRLPVLPQEDVANADPSLPIQEKICAKNGETPDGLSTLTWNTHTVAARQAETCKAHGWKKVIVVAFPPHMGRAVAVYRKVGLVPLPAKMPPGTARYTCSQIKDPTLRFPIGAIAREFLARLLFFWKGWM